MRYGNKRDRDLNALIELVRISNATFKQNAKHVLSRRQYTLVIARLRLAMLQFVAAEAFNKLKSNWDRSDRHRFYSRTVESIRLAQSICK